MENASKALIMGGSVLIGVILLTTMVYIFRSTGNFASTYDDKLEKSIVEKFNEQFTSYIERKDITTHELISIINLAENYNEKENNVMVDVIIDGRSYITGKVLNEKDKINELQNNTNMYTCLGVEYDQFTRKVSVIEFRHI